MWAAGLALAESARISSTAEGSKTSGTKSSAGRRGDACVCLVCVCVCGVVGWGRGGPRRGRLKKEAPRWAGAAVDGKKLRQECERRGGRASGHGSQKALIPLCRQATWPALAPQQPARRYSKACAARGNKQRAKASSGKANRLLPLTSLRVDRPVAPATGRNPQQLAALVQRGLREGNGAGQRAEPGCVGVSTRAC